MKRSRVIIVAISVFCMFLGGFGSLLTMPIASSEVKISYQQKPMYFIGQIAADHNGFIYYTLNEYSSIQVYDLDGAFIHRIVIPNNSNLIGEKFKWKIDDVGTLHIVDWQGRYFVIDGMEVVFEENLSYDKVAELYKQYHAGNTIFVERDSFQYLVTGKTIEKFDADGKHLYDIYLDAPLFPPPMAIFIILLATGLIGVWAFGFGLKNFPLRLWSNFRR